MTPCIQALDRQVLQPDFNSGAMERGKERTVSTKLFFDIHIHGMWVHTLHTYTLKKKKKKKTFKTEKTS